MVQAGEGGGVKASGEGGSRKEKNFVMCETKAQKEKRMMP